MSDTTAVLIGAAMPLLVLAVLQPMTVVAWVLYRWCQYWWRKLDGGRA